VSGRVGLRQEVPVSVVRKGRRFAERVLDSNQSALAVKGVRDRAAQRVGHGSHVAAVVISVCRRVSARIRGGQQAVVAVIGEGYGFSLLMCRRLRRACPSR